MRSRPAAAALRAAVPWMLLTCAPGLGGWPPPARAEGQEAPRRDAVRPAAAVTAKELPARCARCHDADGTGRAARASLREIPDFSNHKWQASRSDTELLVSILDGRGSHMPAFRGKLRDDEARALVASVRGFDPAPGAASAAATEFERRFHELEKELEDLKKQFREASAPPRKR